LIERAAEKALFLKRQTLVYSRAERRAMMPLNAKRSEIKLPLYKTKAIAGLKFKREIVKNE
jgi:hypothetical protein